jgi:Fe-S-cluster-containing hydrogenase component 2
MPKLGSGNVAEAAASARAEQGFLHLLAEACVTIQRPGTPCLRCAEACPAGAISIGERTVAISHELCSGCGRCAPVCPTEVLTVDGFALPSGRMQIRIECSRVPPPGCTQANIVVPCLGGLTANHLRASLATGTEEIVLVDRGWCATCPAGGTDTPWDDVLARLGRELDLLGMRRGPSVRVETRSLPKESALSPPVARRASSETLTRRQLFARLANPKPKPTASHASACDQPPSVIRTDALIERRAQLARIVAGPLPGALFPAASIADTCCDNLICTRACPTGALRSIQESGVGGVAFDAALCIACGACEEACPTHSITIHAAGEGVYEGSVPLRRHDRRICAQCGAEFSTHDGRSACLACSKDAEIVRLGHDLMRRRAAPRPRASGHRDIPSRSVLSCAQKTCEQEGAS